MRGLQRLGNLLRDRQRLIQRDRPCDDPVGKRRAFNQLQDERLGVVTLLDAVDGGDAGVVQAGEHLRFPLEPGEPVGVSGEGVRQDLQRDIAAELGVGGAIDLPHPAFTDQGGDVVMPQPRTDLEGHLCVYRVVRRSDRAILRLGLTVTPKIASQAP